jgi:amino acid transporter
VQNVTTLAKYGGLVFIILLAFALGLPRTGAANYTPAIPAGSLSVAPFGLALVSVLWAFDGWADLSFVGGEVKDPRRNLPRALIIGTLAVILVYPRGQPRLPRVLSIDEIRASRLVAAEVAERLVGAPGVVFVALTVMLSTFGTLNGRCSPRRASSSRWPTTGSSSSRSRASTRASRRRTSRSRSRRCSGILFVLVRTFEQLADAFVTAIIPFYALGVASVFVLRRRPGYAPPFRVPGYPVVPALFILSTIYLLGNALIDPRAGGPRRACWGRSWWGSRSTTPPWAGAARSRPAPLSPAAGPAARLAPLPRAA